MVKRHLLVAGLLGSMLLAVGCASPKGKTIQEKQQYTLDMRDKAVMDITAKKPEAKAAMDAAPGYLVIEDCAWGVGFFGSGGGYGVAVDNATKQMTYIKVFHLLPGFGIAGKVDRQIVVFEDADMFKKIINKDKWDTSAEAEAAFKFGKTGGSALATGSFDKKIKVYELTDGGIVLRALIPINDYYKDNDLNEAAPPPAMK